MKKLMFNVKYCLTQAVLNGTKTMTRRKLKIPKTCNDTEVYDFNVLTNSLGTQCVDLIDYGGNVLGSWKPHYEVGEVVAIAQSYKHIASNRDKAETVLDLYKIGNNFLTMDEMGAGWDNKMFVKADLLPHHIKITDVKVERLQDISDDDIMREGVREQIVAGNKDYYFETDKVVAGLHCTNLIFFKTPREAFASLIDKVSGNGIWDSNPWVVAYSFELVD